MSMAKQATGKTRKWKPIFLVKIYRLVRLGVTEKEICATLGFTTKTLFYWRREFPELEEAILLGRRELSDGESMPSWLFKHLSPEMEDLWNKIQVWGRQEGGKSKIELLLEDSGKRIRQQLFLYALCVCKFSSTRAMKKVLITKKDLDRWLLEPEFREIMEEVEWHKGNFFEESLVRLVQEGNPQAVLFANKTFNKDRGYVSKSVVDVNHSGSIMHGVVDLGELVPYLSVEAKMELMNAIRSMEERKLPAPVLTVVEKVGREIANSVEDG